MGRRDRIEGVKARMAAVDWAALGAQFNELDGQWLEQARFLRDHCAKGFGQNGYIATVRAAAELDGDPADGAWERYLNDPEAPWGPGGYPRWAAYSYQGY